MTGTRPSIQDGAGAEFSGVLRCGACRAVVSVGQGRRHDREPCGARRVNTYALALLTLLAFSTVVLLVFVLVRVGTLAERVALTRQFVVPADPGDIPTSTK